MASQNWDPRVKCALRDYRRPVDPQPTIPDDPDEANVNHPYWILLPAWIQGSSPGITGETDRENDFLHDVLSAQYFLFLAFRIRDDLMDEPDTDPVLAGAIDPLLRDAGVILSKYFSPTDDFWEIYRADIVATADAIVEVDHLQQSPATDLAEMRHGYSRVNAVFKIGSEALCRYLSRTDDLPAIRAFCDKFSIGCQLLDDLSDIGEDLDRGRYNYAANFSLRLAGDTGPGKGSDLERITASLTSGVAGLTLLREAGELIADAFETIKPLGFPLAERCQRVYTASIDAMRAGLFTAAISINANLITHSNVHPNVFPNTAHAVNSGGPR